MLPQFENSMIFIFEHTEVCHIYFSHSERLRMLIERRMVSSEWRMGDAERTIRHSPIDIPIAPCQLSKGLKTLKTAMASYWLELAWIWDRRHSRGRMVSSEWRMGAPNGPFAIRHFAHRKPANVVSASVTILLNTRSAQPGQSELIDRDLPTQELVDGERITRACFLERKQASAHRGDDLGFASDHPPLGRRRRQIGDRQRASVRAYDVFHPRSKRFTHLTLTTQRNCLSREHKGLSLRFA